MEIGIQSLVQYETFGHEADIGIRGFGNSVEEAFENAAKALYSVMVNVNAVQPQTVRTVTASASDVELLFIEWLNSLLTLTDLDRIFFSKFKVKLEGTFLHGTAWGESFNKVRHEPNVEVKGASYHLLSVKEENGRYVAQCVVDV